VPTEKEIEAEAKKQCLRAFEPYTPTVPISMPCVMNAEGMLIPAQAAHRNEMMSPAVTE
jgi:hypothetical protein